MLPHPPEMSCTARLAGASADASVVYTESSAGERWGGGVSSAGGDVDVDVGVDADSEAAAGAAALEEE